MKWKVWVGTNSKYYFSLEDSERKIVTSSGYNSGHEVIDAISCVMKYVVREKYIERCTTGHDHHFFKICLPNGRRLVVSELYKEASEMDFDIKRMMMGCVYDIEFLK